MRRVVIEFGRPVTLAIIIGLIAMMACAVYAYCLVGAVVLRSRRS